MKLSRLIGKRIKEVPKDAQSASHIFLVRGGYIRLVSSGIYSLLPIGKRIVQKIESIIREEMNAVDGQEVLMPVVLPRELWDESGRYESVGAELLRFRDRNDKEMLLGMTHEEAVCHLARGELSSYKQLPFMLYQIQTKYRDEARPRAGLIRVREFTMKDGYSFHETKEDLKDYYDRVHEAYARIFLRLGMKNVVSIQSDTGMMGGEGAHEFMAIADCGEDTIFISEDHSYLANREVATTGLKFIQSQPEPLEKVSTPGKKTIEEVSELLKISADQTGKVVFYKQGEKLVMVLIRGDFEVNETKLKNTLKVTELLFANDEEIRSVGAVPGYASPIGIDSKKVTIVVDPSAAMTSNLVVGANEENFHFKGFCFERDLENSNTMIIDIATAREGDPSPDGRSTLKMVKGIEVGNIFQLGTKYSKAMKVEYLDKNGKSNVATMGCYGIGIGRAMAAVIEQSHDDFGPIWPAAIAPWQVHICSLNLKKGEVFDASKKLYEELLESGVEVVWDDRDEKAGSMFKDADLIGVPVRITVSPKTLEQGEVELKTRDGAISKRLKIDTAVSDIAKLVATCLNSRNESC